MAPPRSADPGYPGNPREVYEAVAVLAPVNGYDFQPKISEDRRAWKVTLTNLAFVKIAY